MADFTFKRRSTNVVELLDLEDTSTKQRPTTAVVLVTVTDDQDAEVTDAIAVAMPYVARSRSYRGVLPASIDWTAGAVYTQTITATVGSDVLTLVRVGTAADA